MNVPKTHIVRTVNNVNRVRNTILDNVHDKNKLYHANKDQSIVKQTFCHKKSKKASFTTSSFVQIHLHLKIYAIILSINLVNYQILYYSISLASQF